MDPEDIGLYVWLFIAATRLSWFLIQRGTKKQRAFLELCQEVAYTVWVLEWVIAGIYWCAGFLIIGVLGIIVAYKKWRDSDDDDDDKHWKLRKSAAKSKIPKPVAKTLPVPT